jgi:hypothetical protein
MKNKGHYVSKYKIYKKWMCYIDGQKNKYSVLNECNIMLKYNIPILKQCGQTVQYMAFAQFAQIYIFETTASPLWAPAYLWCV